MFYTVKVKDHIRVPPHMFHLSKKESILENIKSTYENYISKDMGFVINVTDVGAFMDMGGAEGMVHISQSMDDFVSFSKDKVLQGKKSGQSLKINDRCKARIIAVSYKDMNNPKIGLTMRQEGLGKLEWLEQLPPEIPAAEGKETKSKKRKE